jgi:hypothetical protein
LLGGCGIDNWPRQTSTHLEREKVNSEIESSLYYLPEPKCSKRGKEHSTCDRYHDAAIERGDWDAARPRSSSVCFGCSRKGTPIRLKPIEDFE